jgi:hypothetical protein
MVARSTKVAVENKNYQKSILIMQFCVHHGHPEKALSLSPPLLL